MLHPICVVFSLVWTQSNIEDGKSCENVSQLEGFNNCSTSSTCQWWSSAFRCLIWLASNSKCRSESCYVRNDEGTSQSQRPEAATIGLGALWNKGFLEISQNSQECASLFFYRTLLGDCICVLNVNLIQGFWLYL